MPEILMLLSNAFHPDPRVEKEANSLANAGYSVTVLCWDRMGELPVEETLASGVRILRLQRVRSAYRVGVKQMLYTPRFWSAAIRQASTIKPDLVHCHDLDTLYAGVQIKKKLGCRLVFDAHEDYPVLMSLYLPGMIVRMLAVFQRFLLHSVDAVIATSLVHIDKLGKVGLLPAVHLPNVQDLTPFERVSADQVGQTRRQLGLDSGDYVVGYIGGFSRTRLIMPLVEAVRSLPGATLLLAGDGHQRQDLENAIQDVPNVRYLGWLPIDQVPRYTCLCDVIYYSLNPKYTGAVINSPNTLFNAMAAARPIIANNIGDLGRIVQKTGCGLLLDEVSPETIRAAIHQLNDPALRRKLGEAGRLAAQTEYNWHAVEQRLLQLYTALLK
jgi:glycosyltransferase involved in cell wall biosynthesis